jgi:excisionase family DNA binding protein
LITVLQTKMLRVRQVALKLGCGVSTIWMWVGENRFPAPVHLGDNRRVAVWPEADVDAWLEEKIRKARGTDVEATPAAS